MRIRKNAKLSSLWFGSSSHALAPESLQTHVCQLNQSPWDAISFGPDSSHQFEGEDSFMGGNSSLGDSVGAEESVASMMNAVAAKAEYMVVDDNDILEKQVQMFDHGEERSRRNEFGSEKLRLGGRISSCCQKNDGKGWQCRNEAKEGQSFCDHHLYLLRSYNNMNYSNNTIGSLRRTPAAAAGAVAGGARRSRGRAGKKGSFSNPYEFYYYSGFGPLWGRKRGDKGSGGNKIRNIEAAKLVDNNGATTNTSTGTYTTSQRDQSTPSSSQFDNGEDFDYVDEEENEKHVVEDAAANNNESCKKRMRKPVKARSLKSLM